jgi:Na+-transporting NADH:ubiquinone oxidoreductase subunit NqrB
MAFLSHRSDPRLYQIAVLSSLLAWGIFGLELEVRPEVAAATVATALAVQWLGTRAVRLRGVPLRFDPRSALISSLSLTLLLRTTSPALGALAAVLAVGSKFVIRVPGPRDDRLGSKHVFNPANFGIVAMLLLTDRAWVSPGQWGSAALAAFAVASVGFLVVRRAERSDVTWAFLLFYGGLLFGRALWLGDPLAIPRHQLANGALLVFAFFMISDPKTTPDSRPGRVLFALLVAAGAGVVQFALYQPAGPIWALAALAPAVPLIDRWLPGGRYRWPGRGPQHTRSAAPRRSAAEPPARSPVPVTARTLTERSTP